MQISVNISSSQDRHRISVSSNGDEKSISIDPKITGFGSSVNGGEMLLLSLATCFCNDLYREAKKRSVQIDAVEIFCSGQFGGEGEPGSDFTYRAKVDSPASPEEIQALLRITDQMAEVHNTLRKGLAITLVT